MSSRRTRTSNPTCVEYAIRSNFTWRQNRRVRLVKCGSIRIAWLRRVRPFRVGQRKCGSKEGSGMIQSCVFLNPRELLLMLISTKFELEPRQMSLAPSKFRTIQPANSLWAMNTIFSRVAPFVCCSQENRTTTPFIQRNDSAVHSAGQPRFVALRRNEST